MARLGAWPPTRILAGLGFPLLSALLVGSFWVVPYLPTNDGPEWVYVTHMENHYGDPGSIYRDYYVPALQFASRGFTLLYGPFEAWLGWQHGLQVTLGVMALMAAWGFVALVWALDPRRWALGFLGFPLALSWGLYMGVWAYVAASGFGLFVLAFAVREREPAWPRRVVLSLLLTVQAAAHVFSAVVTGSVLLLLFLSRAPRGGRLAELRRVVLLGLPAMAILLLTSLASNETRKLTAAQGVQFLSLRELLAVFPQTLAPGSLARALVATVAILGAAALALRRMMSRETTPVDWGLGIASIALLLGGAFAPITIPGWQFFSQRFVPLGAALACAVVPLERVAVRRRLTVACLFAGSFLYVALAYPFHQRLAATCRDAIAGLFADVHRHGVVLPVPLNPVERVAEREELKEVPWLEPLLHMGELYSAALGGLTPYAFPASAATLPFAPRTGPGARPFPPVPDPDRYWALEGRLAFSDTPERYALEDEVTAHGVFYEGIVALGASPLDVALWRRRGYVADWEQGATMLAHFEPCHVDFTVSPGTGDPGPVFDVSAAGFDLVSGQRVPSHISADGFAHFELPRTPCGDIEIRARWADATGAAAYCRNADGRGILNPTVTRDSSGVMCERAAIAAPVPTVHAP